MRSDNQNLLVGLVTSRSATVTYGDRNFKFLGPAMWNELLIEMRNCDDVETFKKHLKTVLFKDTFDYINVYLLCVFCDVISGSFNHDCDSYGNLLNVCSYV